MRGPAWDASVAEVLHPRTRVDDALVSVIDDLKKKGHVKAPVVQTRRLLTSSAEFKWSRILDTVVVPIANTREAKVLLGETVWEPRRFDVEDHEYNRGLNIRRDNPMLNEP